MRAEPACSKATSRLRNIAVIIIER
jgi:hypothetical protein